MPSQDPTPWAVNCPTHAAVFLTRDEYFYQMSRPDRLWDCPMCGQSAEWDDDNYEESMDDQEEGE